MSILSQKLSTPYRFLYILMRQSFHLSLAKILSDHLHQVNHQKNIRYQMARNIHFLILTVNEGSISELIKTKYTYLIKESLVYKIFNKYEDGIRLSTSVSIMPIFISLVLIGDRYTSTVVSQKIHIQEGVSLSQIHKQNQS